MQAPRVAVISWLGGAISVLPFAQEWFELSSRASNLCLFAAVVSAVALGFAIHFSRRLARIVAALAGPPEPRARALVLVAAFSAAGLSAMVALTWLVGSA